MNPYRDSNPTPLPGPPLYSPPDPLHDSQSSSVSIMLPSATVLHSSQTSSDQNQVQSSSESSFSSGISQTVNPYPNLAPVCQVSVIVPTQCSADCPDLECSICFSQFNNVFQCPKMLQCRHTFCLECLARINVKSAEPSAIQCPLCRSLTPLPALGLPKLTTDSDVLSYLPAAMQRVYSVRFLRNKGKLQVKRSSEGQRSLTSLQLMNRSLDVGLPSPPVRAEVDGVGGALFRLTGQPPCRAFLLMSVVMMMVVLTGIIIYIFIFNKDK